MEWWVYKRRRTRVDVLVESAKSFCFSVVGFLILVLS